MTIEATEKAANKLNIVYTISHYLGKEMSAKKYGNIEKIICIMNCYDPNFSSIAKDWETGTVIGKKYIKRNKFLEFSIKVNHAELMKCPQDEVPDIIKKAILKTYFEIRDLCIIDFKIDEFYSDLESLLSLSKWKANPEDYIQENFDYEKSVKPQSENSFKAMKEGEFWNVIKDSIKTSRGDINLQTDCLINILARLREEDIIGFEITLRSMIKKANHVNVLALNKIVEGTVTDDSFLYFRAKLILLGKANFYQAIKDPNQLDIIINSDQLGEELLSVADKAFTNKLGTNYHGELPRDIIWNLISYDDLSEDPKGIMWQETEFKGKYANVLALYPQK